MSYKALDACPGSLFHINPSSVFTLSCGHGLWLFWGFFLLMNTMGPSNYKRPFSGKQSLYFISCTFYDECDRHIPTKVRCYISNMTANKLYSFWRRPTLNLYRTGKLFIVMLYCIKMYTMNVHDKCFLF